MFGFLNVFGVVFVLALIGCRQDDGLVVDAGLLAQFFTEYSTNQCRRHCPSYLRVANWQIFLAFCVTLSCDLKSMNFLNEFSSAIRSQ